ncbi:hypothetical protein [Myxococcus landrumensis]|uniref:hypothetical protein n=1 Tax=Myxococcus landrumensis TaxID=2813577 RepID=UPI001F509240|nr:hypothetical protein [Myxococcus landrumus]
MRDKFLLRLAAALFALAPGVGCLNRDAASPEVETSVPAASAPCVYFKSLAPFLPETLEGFTVARTQGSTGKYGEVSVSEAERLFTRGEGREVKVRIVDTTMGGKIGQAIRDAAERAKGKAPSDPTAPIHWQDAVGFVRYDADEALAEANLLVGERFVVAITSRGFPGTVEVRRVARGIDLAGLAKLQ